MRSVCMPNLAISWDYTGQPGYKMFPHLFQPVRIGRLTVPNRIKYAATEDNFNTHDGFVTDVDVAYIRERAKGVVGGICTIQGVYMDPKGEGKGYVGQAAAYDDKFIPGLKRLADAIHGEGAIANIQLMHCGRVGGIELPYCVGPSAIPQRLRIFRPVKEMSKDDIKQCIKEHADAARRGIEAGFDIIEISGIVGYLISNFLSKYTNRRTDEYGGDIEGRCRFMVEVIQAVRDVIGKDVPIIIRLCAEELLDDVNGNTPEECMITYKMAEKAGVDCISVTQGWQESVVPVITRDVPQGSWLYNAKRAKEAGIKVPLSMAYRLFKPEIADKAIADGIIDIWEMCRPMIADPHLPKKVLEGRLEDIRPCIACNLCLARLFRDAPMTCSVNPLVGHEWDPEWQVKPAEARKKVMIVGGGPAGLECARVAALRGYEVHLYEKRDILGGQLVAASKGPFGEDELYGVITWLITQCRKAGVNFHLNTTVTPSMMEEEAPDVIVIATGARFTAEKVPGFDRPNVVSAVDVLEGRVETGEKVVVWGGKGAGIVTALYLANKGRKVSMVCMDRRVGRDVNPSYVWRYIQKLNQLGVRVYRNSSIERITEDGVIVKAPYDVRIPIAADTVIYAEREAVADLVEAARAVCPEVYVIGDALVPRRLQNAIHDGYRIGIRM
ncbi:MAG: FAD-dependent oxidoreductase [Candidatus Nezhaarchaeales archaeon]